MSYSSTRKTRRAALLALLVGTVLLGTAACGAQSLTVTDDVSPDPAAPAAAAPASTAVDAPSADLAADVINAIVPSDTWASKVPAAVRTKGLQMTTSVGYPPMELFGPDEKTIIGVDPALGRAIAAKLGIAITIADEDFNAQIPGLVTGRFDIIMSSMTDNAERRETVSFVDYVSAGNGFLVAKGNPSGVKVPADLCGQKIAVVDNGSALIIAQKFDEECAAAGKSAIDILRFPGDAEATLQVRNGRADATITDYPVAVTVAADPTSGVEAIAIDGDESPWGIAVAKEKPDMLAAVQGALQELIDSGEYGKILDAYGVSQMAVKSAIVNAGE